MSKKIVLPYAVRDDSTKDSGVVVMGMLRDGMLQGLRFDPETKV